MASISFYFYHKIVEFMGASSKPDAECYRVPQLDPLDLLK